MHIIAVFTSSRYAVVDLPILHSVWRRIRRTEDYSSCSLVAAKDPTISPSPVTGWGKVCYRHVVSHDLGAFFPPPFHAVCRGAYPVC